MFFCSRVMRVVVCLGGIWNMLIRVVMVVFLWSWVCMVDGFFGEGGCKGW